MFCVVLLPQVQRKRITGVLGFPACKYQGTRVLFTGALLTAYQRTANHNALSYTYDIIRRFVQQQAVPCAWYQLSTVHGRLEVEPIVTSTAWLSLRY